MIGIPTRPRLGFLISRPYVNRGRWIAECECRSASVVQPEQRVWACTECGCSYRLLWPSRRREIERLLAPRPVTHQNWEIGEAVTHLLHENIEHGLAREPD